MYFYAGIKIFKVTKKLSINFFYLTLQQIKVSGDGEISPAPLPQTTFYLSPI